MVVSTRKDCRVIWPKHGDQEKLAQLTQEREPLLDGMWGFVDGLNLQIRNPGDDDVQNAYYNGWLGYTAASAVIIWRADGLIGFFNGNYPGSWHDGASRASP